MDLNDAIETAHAAIEDHPTDDTLTRNRVSNTCNPPADPAKSSPDGHSPYALNPPAAPNQGG